MSEATDGNIPEYSSYDTEGVEYVKIENDVPDYSSYSSQLVQVRVGKTSIARDFHIHHNVLAKSSKFFQTRLKSEWNTELASPIMLPDYLPATFDIYTHYLYTGKLEFSKKTIELWAANMRSADLYVLGEYIVDQGFQDVVMNQWIDNPQCTFQPDRYVIKRIYNGTPTGSPARRLVVDWWSHHVNPAWQEEWGHTTTMPLEFVEDLLTAFIERKGWEESTFHPGDDPDAYSLLKNPSRKRGRGSMGF